ncbi:MAG: sensor domain-containing diguanylate cyclase [Candidatus Aminicenantes bacterium]|nr:sensor domain-containing diguanylate cyclase [Candidatus Aminicenantes bacterium]
MKNNKMFSFFSPSRKTELIYSIGAHISAELDFDRLLLLIVERVRSALGVSYCAILIKEGGDLVIRAVTEYPENIIGKRIPLGQGITGRCAMDRKEMLIPDLSRCDFYIHLGDSVFRSELDVPIVFHDSVLGVINVQSTRKNDFTRNDIQLLKTLSNQIGVALHNSQVLAQLQLVQDIGLKLVSISKPEKLFASIVTEARHRLHYDTCAILEVSDDHLVFKASSGDFPETLVSLKIPIGKGITGRCAVEKRVVNVGDVRLEADYVPSGIQDIRSEIACPVISEEKLLGVITIESRNVNAFGEDDVRLLSILSLQVAVGMRNARMYAEMEKMAVTDQLTGLYNYRYFHQRLGAEIARSQRYRHPLSIIMIDLDDFKMINDRYGHLTGDRVLREAAQTFRKNIRRYDEPMVLKGGELDIVSRYGGEEFIIIQPDTPLEGALVCAERLREILESSVGQKAGLPYDKNSAQRVTGSFGVTAFDFGESLDSMIRRADTAMYQAKDQGKNRVVGL